MTPAKDQETRGQDSMTGRPMQVGMAGEVGDTAGRRRMTQRPRALDVAGTTGACPRPEKIEAEVQTGIGPGRGRHLARPWSAIPWTAIPWTAIPLPTMTQAAIKL